MRIANDLTQAIDYDEVAAKRDQCVCEIINHSIQLNVVVNSVATPVKFILLAKTVSQQPYRSAAIDPIATLRKRLLTTKTAASIPELLQTAIGDASEKFYQYQQQNTTGNKIGVSILLAAIVEQGEQGEQVPHLYINHLGSCRAYLLRKGKLHPLTADHSYIRFLLDTGGASWETANKHSGKAELTNYLGLNRYEKGDANLITPPEDGEVWSYRTKVSQQPTQSLELKEEDKLIFVTSDPTDDGSKIRQVVEKSPEQAVNELLQQSITAAAIIYWEKPKFALRNILGGRPHAKPQSQVASSGGKSRGVGITAFLGLLGVLIALGIWANLPPSPQRPTTTTPTATITLSPANTEPEQSATPTVSTITPTANEIEQIPEPTSGTITAGTPVAVVQTPTATRLNPAADTPTVIPPTIVLPQPITPNSVATPLPLDSVISETTTIDTTPSQPSSEIVKKRVVLHSPENLGNGIWRFSWDSNFELGNYQYELTLCQSLNGPCLGMDTVSGSTNRPISLTKWNETKEIQGKFEPLKTYVVRVFLYDDTQTEGQKRQSILGETDFIFPSLEPSVAPCPAPCQPSVPTAPVLPNR